MKRQVIGRRGPKIRALNRRRAVRHHCQMCCDFDWQGVVECDNAECPLHPYRFGRCQDGNGVDVVRQSRLRAAAIGRFCYLCSGEDEQCRDQCAAEQCSLFPYRNGHNP